MNRTYKLFSMGLVLAMALLGLLPAVSAEGPSGVALKGLVPPRPDLAEKLLTSPAPSGGLGLAADADATSVSLAYQQYLGTKLNAKARANVPSKAKAEDGNVSLSAAPADERAMVVLAEFADLAHNTIPKPVHPNNTDFWVQDFSPAQYQTMLFSEGDPWSLRNYFREASDFGANPTAFDLEGDVNGWVTLPGNAAEYGNDGLTGVDNDTSDGYDIERLVIDAAEAALSGLALTWDAYSSDTGPRYSIDYFVVVHSGTGQESGGGALGDDAVWSVQGTLSSTYSVSSSSFDIDNYLVVAEDTPVGAYVHEFGHLFGLPDTWNDESSMDEIAWPDQDQGGIGEAAPAFYDSMGQGCWLGRPLGTRPASMTAWERIELEWLTPAVWDLSTLPASIYLAQLETPSSADKALKIELPARTYVTPHSGVWMRQAPLWTNLAMNNGNLEHTFGITGTYQVDFSFWHVYDLEPGHDYGYVQVRSSTISPSWTNVYTVTGQQPNPIQGEVSDWNPVTIDLSAYASEPDIDIRFRLERDDAIEGLGWFIDDVSLVQNGVETFQDDIEAGAGSWTAARFPRRNAFQSEHYYLAEWRNDLAGFDVGLQEAYNMLDIASGEAEWFRYNPGLLIWYANPIYLLGDNDVVFHPGEGFLLAIDSHPDPLLEDSTALPWRTRVQMQDATFRAPGMDTYENDLTDSGDLLNTVGPLPATSFFWDRYSSYPYWDPIAFDNSAKTLQYGVKLEVTGENLDQTGATIRFSIDAADMSESIKLVDKDWAYPGDTLTYRIILTNTGIADAHTVRVQDPAPMYSTYVSNSLLVDGVAPPDIDDHQSPDGIDWMGTVYLTDSVELEFQVQLDPVIDDGTIIRNIAHVLEGTVPEVDLIAETVVESAPCISATKHDDPDDVLAGGLITYTIGIANSGNMDAMAVLTDCIPACTTVVSNSWEASIGLIEFVPPADSDCLNGNGEIRWTGPVTVPVPLPDPLEPTVWITYQVLVDPGQTVCTSIINEGTIWDGHEGYENFWVSTKVLPGPNLYSSEKTVDKAVAAPGDTLSYAILVYNSGNREGNVTLTDVMPMDTTYISPSLAYTGGTGSFDGVDTISWSKIMQPGEMQTVTFDVEVAAPLDNGTWITNTALLELLGGDAYERSAYTLIESRPILDPADGSNSAKTYEPDPLGDVITYTITLCNIGTQDTTVEVYDQIPAGTAYSGGPIEVTPGAGSAAYVAGPPPRIEATLVVTAGECVTLTFPVDITITGTGIITNVAEIYDTVLDETFYLSTTTTVAAITLVEPTDTRYCGDLVRIPVRIDNVMDLQGFQITVDFDPDALNVENIVPGTWFSPAGWNPMSFDNGVGTSTVAAELISSVGLDGSGDLYYLDFRAVGSVVSSPLTVTYSLLADTPWPSFHPIPHNVITCEVTIEPREVMGRVFLQGRTDHTGAEIYINGIKLAETAADGSFAVCPPVGYGDAMVIEARHFGYLTATQSQTLGVTDTLTLNDVTLLGGDPIGPQELVTTPLTCTTPITIPVAVAGPPDAKVNVLDLTFVGARFGKMANSDPDWNKPGQTAPPAVAPYDPCEVTKVNWKADINEDDIVNIFDLVLVGNNFGRIGPTIWP